MDQWEGIDDLIVKRQTMYALQAIMRRGEVPLRVALELYDERFKWLRDTPVPTMEPITVLPNSTVSKIGTESVPPPVKSVH